GMFKGYWRSIPEKQGNSGAGAMSRWGTTGLLGTDYGQIPTPSELEQSPTKSFCDPISILLYVIILSGVGFPLEKHRRIPLRQHSKKTKPPRLPLFRVLHSPKANPPTDRAHPA